MAETTSVDLFQRARPYVPGPQPLEDTGLAGFVMITQPAVLARTVPGYLSLLVLRCGAAGCGRPFATGSARSFAARDQFAEANGWRRDVFGTWTCLACQREPGYWAPNRPAVRDAEAEYALITAARDRAGSPAVLAAKLHDAKLRAAA